MDVRRLVRHVDGVGHVVLGPPLLLLSAPVADALSVPVGWLRPFLVVFVAYGVAVLVATRSGPELGPGSEALVAVGNAAFLVAVSWSLVASSPSNLGTAAHLAGLAGAVAMIAVLTLDRRRRSAGRSARGAGG